MVRRFVGWPLLVAVFVLVGAVVVGSGVVGRAGGSPAYAFCDRPSRPMWWSVGWAEETVRWNSTCDDLGDYYGKVLDSKRDGRCVTLYSEDDWEFAWVERGRSCGAWKNIFYAYADANAWWRVCKTIGDVPQVCAEPAYNWGF